MAPKSKQTKNKISAATATAKMSKNDRSKHQPPNWPAMQPLIPSSDLTFCPLLPDQILTIPRFWTSSLCNTYVGFLSDLPLMTTPARRRKGEAVRVNDRYQVDDDAFAELLWSEMALKKLVQAPVTDGRALNESERRKLWGGEVLGLSSNIRIYRYSKGHFFDKHYDDSDNISFPSPTALSPIPAKTTWTLFLYLSSSATGCQGGETVFYPGAAFKHDAAPSPVVAELDVGMALLHRHGKDCLLHEGREVTAGEKWVVRSDLCVRR